ncbi:hypothetical protein F511_35744 [Dorcoceras hygrometricum]|uniref:Uncharacterized protein n=1 Tax=Dorcoceras hygrometricum TaxID=472368 RepID=A0A2Z7BJ09_9LAMI|nr:hypothetical protein F511_35744 [Dorcoceras hygrometricum]
MLADKPVCPFKLKGAGLWLATIIPFKEQLGFISPDLISDDSLIKRPWPLTDLLAEPLGSLVFLSAGNEQ